MANHASNCAENNNNETADDPRMCEHFSIRGYVSEIRKKDPKQCYPFPLKDSTELMYDLPPMTVPHFKHWLCTTDAADIQNNPPKDSSEYLAGDEEAAPNGADANVTAFDLLPEQSADEINNATRGPDAQTTNSDNSNNDKNHSPASNILPDRKGKGKAHVTDEIPQFAGCGNGFLRDASNQRALQQFIAQIEVNQSTDDKGDLRLEFNQNKAPVPLHKDDKAQRTTEVRPSEGSVNLDPQASSENRHAESPTNGREAEMGGITSPSYSRSKMLVNLPDLNECGGEPSYEVNNEATVTVNNNSNFCEDDDDYFGVERRKNPRSRLVSELLSSTEIIQNLRKGKKKILSPNSSQDENIKRNKVGPIDIKVVNNGKMITEISGSECKSGSDYEVSAEKVSNNLGKRRYKSKEPSLEMNKKMKVDHRSSASMCRQKIKLNSESNEKGKSPEELPLRVDLLARNSVLTRKRGRISQARIEPSKSRMPIECGATQNNGETEKIAATENVQKPSENGQHVLTTYPTKAYDELSIQNKVGLHPSLFQVEELPVDKNKLPREKEDSPVICENQSNGEGCIDLPTSLSDKKSRTPEAEGCSPHAQPLQLMQVSYLAENKKEQTKEGRGRIPDIDINSIPTDDKTTDQLSLGEDIHEIVELMAKNQYERHIDGPMDNRVSSLPPLSATYEKVKEANGSYGQHMQIFGPSNFLSLQNPPPSATNPRNSVFNADTGNYSNCNSNNHLDFRRLPRENPVSSRFHYPNQDIEYIRPYTSRRLPPSKPSEKIGAVAHQYPPSFLREMDVCQKFKASGPQSSSKGTEPCQWPPGVPSRVPLGITNPQMISQSSNLLSNGRILQQCSGNILNFSNAYNNQNPDCSSSSAVDVNAAIPALNLLLMQNARTLQCTELSLGPPQNMTNPASSRYPFSRPSNHTVLPSASPPPSFQNGKGNYGRTSNGYMVPIPSTLQQQRNRENSRFTPPSRDSWPVRLPMSPPLDKSKGVVSMPLQGIKESSKLQCEISRCTEKTASPASGKVICRLNQNPSDFNDLRLLAQYMIGPEDLRPKKRGYTKVPRPRGNSKRHDQGK